MTNAMSMQLFMKQEDPFPENILHGLRSWSEPHVLHPAGPVVLHVGQHLRVPGHHVGVGPGTASRLGQVTN